ncbi:hypothetical protein FVEN_g5682 [Fusarium venenatum]|uniref:Zn(2)-C6 fungal-type domain-containing protein n=1 Tax=Fusarium venenatum TaxID=56646 RepID=A0A2L2T9J0_9HYPO|nr:uncharacterized protein FVRRES_04104 [Fusarium venenatum]KAG8356341.1 hypothetical protein FVEN_g5682 [Fusarium venenatum]CEI67592.1 unnamed protein product [Fusarium venenatum]
MASTISRRTHKKSRLGCMECKRRHIKCDERQPSCGNCVVSERPCSFPSPRPHQSRPVSPSLSVSNRGPKYPKLEPLSWSIGSPVERAAGFRNDVNMQHMELLIHFSVDIPLPDIDEALQASFTKLVLNVGLDAPYLLYQTLASSARHLATVKPSLSPIYLRQTTELQHSSIEKFNSLNLRIDDSNCVPALLFSSFLARDMLTSTLAAVRQHQDFSLFFHQYIQYIHVQRGVEAIGSSTWPYLIQSELRPLLIWGSRLSELSPQGRELSELIASITRNSALDKEATEACITSVHYLQVGLDYLLSSKSRKTGIQMVFNWAVLIPTRYIELLTLREPQALVILGHYAVLLHLCKDVWQVGDSGRYVLGGIVKELSSKWVQMLWWPLSVIGLGLGWKASFEASRGTSTE